MSYKQVNWPLWTGLLLAVFAFISYPFLFVRFAITRDFPWANLAMFAIAAVLVFVGLKRAFVPGATRVRKIGGAIAGLLSLAALAMLLLTFFIGGRMLPKSEAAPHVGQKAPDFRLPDTNGNPVTLSELLATPIDGKTPAGVLLVFYRGYW